MDIQEARELVVLAGKKLLDSGLIARTWGNVSCRISDYQFVITPSGKAYENLNPEEIVAVNIEDGSYAGNIKPSSEKDLHAEFYKHRKDVNFIIHTHQINASAVSPLCVDIPVSDHSLTGSVGNKVACAAYGLPGSQKLKKEAISALARSEGKAILLAYHGAVCLGKDMEEAFQVASNLEKICEDFTRQRYMEISGKQKIDDDTLRKDYLKKVLNRKNVKNEIQPGRLYNSVRMGENFTLYSGYTEDDPFPEDGINFSQIGIEKHAEAKDVEGLPEETEIHREIYRRYKAVQAIVHTVSPDIMAVSRTGKAAYPLLDDFAQIIGTSVRVADYNGPDKSARKIAARLKGRNALFIKDNGAICCGSSKYDAFAAVMVLEKGCKAIICATLLGKAKPINPLEALLMRFIYLKKYSKKI
jgi:L-ribulose-5-phosphate 4-epimerase